MLASSLGGGIGLAVAADSRVTLIILFSPYYELPEVAATLRKMMLKTPQTTQE